MTFPVALPLGKHRVHKFRDLARSAVKRVSVPVSVQKLAQMPMTIMGLAAISSGILMLTLTGGIMFIGLALIGLEYLIADDQ